MTFMHLHLLPTWLGWRPSRSGTRVRRKSHGHPHNVVVIVGSLRKESFSLKIANALAKLAPATLKLEVTTLHGISFFNQDLEAAPPADWLAFREKLQKSNGVLFVTPEYNRCDPRRAEERHRRRIAPLWQEFVPRQADRHHLQFAGTARRRQRRQDTCRTSCRAFPARSWGSRKSI